MHDAGNDTFRKLTAAFPDMYVFRKRDHPKRSKRHSHHLTRLLVDDARVEWAEQQVGLVRDKRAFNSVAMPHLFPPFPDPLSRALHPTLTYDTQPRFKDELWPYQWYLAPAANTLRAPVHNLKVAEVWDMGYTGRGVVVSVLDDGKNESFN